MQRYLPVGAVRVVSASSNAPAPTTDYVIDEDCGSADELTEDGAFEVEDETLESEAGSDLSSPISMRVARYLESGKSSGSKKRRRAKLNHLSGDQKVERRKILNRIAAQTARDRKKGQMDDLERFVKELAAENVRLARENADLRSKSSDLEVENVKLRTHLGRPGSSQPQSQTPQQNPQQQTVKQLVPTKPVGIAARVADNRQSVSVEKVEPKVEVIETKPELKRLRLSNDAMEGSRVMPGGVHDAKPNAAAVCADTQQQYSFARRARALFSVLYALLLVSLRGGSAPEVPKAPGSGRAAAGPGTKLERLGVLVARRIARNPSLRDAYWKLRKEGMLTPQTIAWMRQRVRMAARLAQLRRSSAGLSRPTGASLLGDLCRDS